MGNSIFPLAFTEFCLKQEREFTQLKMRKQIEVKKRPRGAVTFPKNK